MSEDTRYFQILGQPKSVRYPAKGPPVDNDLMHDYADLSDLKTVNDVFDEVRKLRKAIAEHRECRKCPDDRDNQLYQSLPAAKTA